MKDVVQRTEDLANNLAKICMYAQEGFEVISHNKDAQMASASYIIECFLANACVEKYRRTFCGFCRPKVLHEFKAYIVEEINSHGGMKTEAEEV